MNALNPSNSPSNSQDKGLSPVVPPWIKWSFTAFMLVLVPVYWIQYSPTNFLYFCDVALFLTLYAVWSEESLPVSMAAVGIVVPQIFWCLDFITELLGLNLAGMTSYMFDEQRSIFLRGLSLFHGWLPFLLIFLVIRLGYDRRALKAWSLVAIALCLIAYFLLPPAGAELLNPKHPRNINYVFGFDDAKPQSMMPGLAYLIAWIAALFTLAWLPAHLVLKKFVRPSPR